MVKILSYGSKSNKGQFSMKKTFFMGHKMPHSFVSGEELIEMVGLTKGRPQHSDAGWLVFHDEGLLKIVSKRPILNSISWEDLQELSLVFGDRTVKIHGAEYKIRLMNGRGDNLETNFKTGADSFQTHGSEWNRLMYRVSGGPFFDPDNKLSSEGIDSGDLASFSERELLTNSRFGHGNKSWCQESAGECKVLRGGAGVSYIERTGPKTSNLSVGWRPLLESLNPNHF